MNFKLQLSLLVLCFVFHFGSYAQKEKSIEYKLSTLSYQEISNVGTPQISAINAGYFRLNIDEIRPQLEGIMHREVDNSGFIANIQFPMPDGSMETYRAKENGTMHPDLAAQFPEIKTYDAAGISNAATVKWDITPHGLHAMIMIPGESTVFIDPIFNGNNEYYIVYRKSDYTSNEMMECDFDSDVHQLKTNNSNGSIKSFGSCDLRTYRLALSATGEYSAFHGGTVPLAQAAQVTTMNRVNGVYEKDMAITMVIIGNNNLIVYTNSATDPFTNGNPGTMINQNQTNTNTVIGSANYDIGHVFGTNSGGLAGLGVVCNNSQKARGVTGSGAPIGDAFDIDYVAHEMGHQFGCNHTFNGSAGSCGGGNRNDPTAVEPGSGSTIMAYAGICAGMNVQPNSDDHFAGISLQEMGSFILGSGGSCAVNTGLANSAPVLISTNGNVTVPANTSFALTAVATDADGDPLTYNWEQMDNEISTQPPVATSTGGPNFRSIPSKLSPTRYFPDLGGIYPGWEVIPSVSRTMSFRVTVRDNSPGAGGCNDHGDITITTDAGSGPFIVQYPSAAGITWVGLTSETVTWSVANTNLAPVACANVDILLSTDGGLTYPTVLASNVPNDGSQVVTVPNLATTTASIMVICSNGTFFDVSDNLFEITMATYDYSLSATPTTLNICQPNDATFDVNIGSVGGYTDPVTLAVSGVPAGATSSFSVNPVTPAGTSILTISNTGSAAPGSYTITITANSTTGTKTIDLNLIISSGAPSTIVLSSPTNGTTGASVPVNFSWIASPEIGVSYTIEVATDAGFSSIVDQASGLTSNSYSSAGLSLGTTYYWRVNATTGCGTSLWSTVFSFTTNTCTTYNSVNVGQTINNATPTVTSTITVGDVGTLTDVNLTLLDITHAYVGDLSATLTSPTGTVISLFNGPGIPASAYGCNGPDMLVSFDDAAANTNADLESTCGATSPAISGDFQSVDLLSLLNGESMTGVWTLTIIDSYPSADDGVLDAWNLELCTAPAVACNNPDVPTATGSSTICAGASATLSVSGGNLNDATDWYWYEGSCGGTLLGTGTSIVVSPGSSTSYFVRGEGACVSPGACTQVEIVVNSTYNQTEDVTICQGDSYIYPDGTAGNSSESHTSSLQSIEGCDSIIITNLSVDSAPAEPSLLSPSNGATGVGLPVSLSWAAPAGSGITYDVQIATDAGFTNIIDAATGLSSSSYIPTGLEPNATYYWQVSASNSCGTSGFTNAFSFTTDGCVLVSSSNIPLTISTSGTPTINSTLNFPYSGSINDINVVDLIGTHTRISDLTITLTSPLGTVITLMDQPCNQQDNFDVDFDDAAASATLPCPPTDGNAYQPVGLLSDFNGENANGTWTLTVIDNQNLQGGSLQAWSLYICIDPLVPCTEPDVPTASSTDICEGDVATLTVTSGNLNDATTWVWYEGSCGGVIVGTGSTISVSPSASTTYFVRGEGACSTPSACAQIDVTVYPTYNTAESASICDGDSYSFGTQTLTSTGTYTEIFSSLNGCDSVVVLNLMVNSIYDETASATICSGDSYIFGTQTLTSSGTYTEPFTSMNGCDSIVTLTLSVVTGFNVNDAATICDGASYSFGSQTLTSAGNYTETFTSTGGCDSIVNLSLSVNPVYNETSAATICSGDSYSFGSQTLTSAGSYTEIFTSISGCDSTVVLTLSVNPSYNTSESASICDGDSYSFGTQTLTSTGTYTEIFSSVNGCDSVVVLNLTVNSSYNETASATICSGDSYIFGTQSLTSSGTYTEPFTSMNGCDSIVTLTLSVVTGFNVNDAATICDGETYAFGSQTLTSAGSYTEVFSSQNGCDSIVVLTLSVNPTYTINESVSICSGENYTYPDGTIGTTTEIHTSVLTSVNACDSIIVTSLEVQLIDNTVWQDQATLTANQIGATYQWVDCDNNYAAIAGELNQSFYATALMGNYAVIVTVGNCSDTSDCYLIDKTGIVEYDFSNVNIFPNPTIDQVSVEWTGRAERIEVTDAKGKLIFLLNVSEESGANIDLTKLSDGIYFLHLLSENGRIVRDVIKQ